MWLRSEARRVELDRLRRNETLAANYAEKEQERAKREAELLARIAELEVDEVGHSVTKAALAAARMDINALTEQVATLKTQLAAALNDAARAELRLVDMDALVSDMESPNWCAVCAAKLGPESHRPDCSLARHHHSAPDSDARLREVMGRAVNESVSTFGVNKSVSEGELGEIRARIIDDVLGRLP